MEQPRQHHGDVKWPGVCENQPPEWATVPAVFIAAIVGKIKWLLA
jgi:hypothetical protein